MWICSAVKKNLYRRFSGRCHFLIQPYKWCMYCVIQQLVGLVSVDALSISGALMAECCTGKTELAKQVARYLHKDNKKVNATSC